MIEELKSRFSYDADTGHFTWLRGSNIGKRAGGISNGYIYLCVNRKMYLAHRVAWLFVHGDWPVQHVDHINRIRTDNRIGNLRQCTPSENQGNCIARRNNPTGYKGVTVHRNKFRAQIRVHSRNMHLGVFETAQEGATAYNAAAIKHFGDFAHLNSTDIIGAGDLHHE